MNDIVQRIVNAIIRQEGMAADYKNPGNLRAAPWLLKPAIENGFWVPPSRIEGVVGIAHVVTLRIAMRQTLYQLISAWAPMNDGNDTLAYIKNVKEWAEIPDENQPLLNFCQCQGVIS